MIYCVEDEDNIREMILYTLTASGFEGKGFADATSFWQGLEKNMPQLIILDIMLPDEDGLSILKKLKLSAKWCDIPVIMATAKGTEYDKISGLDSGADDYLAKPFSMLEMVSRIRAVLRRKPSIAQNTTLSYLGVSLDTVKHIVKVDNEKIDLTLKEFNLLELLLKNPGRVFTRDNLLNIIWEMDYIGESRTVDVHVHKLRSKLGEYGDNIKTVHGVGYSLELKT